MPHNNSVVFKDQNMYLLEKYILNNSIQNHTL